MSAASKSCGVLPAPRYGMVPVRCLLFFFALLFSLCLVVRAQEADSTDRVYKHRKAEVEEALQALKAYTTNRLPVLDGFVNANASTIAKLENPHYQLRIEIESQGPNQTLVAVSAKITAWNAEEDPSRSQYVVVPSNGRLEQDMLDRLSVLLEKGSASLGAGRAAAPASDPAASSSSPAPLLDAPGSNAPISTHSPSPGVSPGEATANPTSPVPPSGSVSRANSSDPAALASEIASIRAERQAAEMSQRKLKQKISELEANAGSQKFLSNLAVVKTPQASIFQQDDDTLQGHFSAPTRKTNSK